MFEQVTHRPCAHDRVVQLRKARQVRNAELQRANQIILDRAQVAAVVQLEKARTELGHIDFHRALSRTGLAGQATGHGVVDFVGEILLPRHPGDTVDGSLGKAFQHIGTARPGAGGEDIDVLLALQTQPFPDQRSAALG